MSKLTLPLIPTLSLLIMLFSGGQVIELANGQEKTWCVAKPSSSDAELTAIIDYACSVLGDRCKLIQEGGSCYYPCSNINHASIVMNFYYQFMGRNKWNCDFRGSGLIVGTNPSYPNCDYA